MEPVALRVMVPPVSVPLAFHEPAAMRFFRLAEIVPPFVPSPAEMVPVSMSAPVASRVTERPAVSVPLWMRVAPSSTMAPLRSARVDARTTPEVLMAELTRSPATDAFINTEPPSVWIIPLLSISVATVAGSTATL